MRALFALLSLTACVSDQSPCADWDPASALPPTTPSAPAASPVARHGRLSLDGLTLRDAHGDAVALHGASSAGTLWWPHGVCVHADSAAWLRDLGADLLRVPTYVEVDLGDRRDGDRAWLDHPACYEDQLHRFVDTAAAAGLYTVIDWHVLGVSPARRQDEALAFWSRVSARYAGRADVIYEIANEPEGATWSQIAGYATEVITRIRENDPDVLIVVGTPGYSSELEEVAAAPLAAELSHNVLYTYHFYAAGGGSYVPDPALELLPYVDTLPLFVTEWGAMGYNGGDALNVEGTATWLDLMARHGLSWAAWQLSDSAQSSGLLRDCETATWSGRTDLSPWGELWADAL